MELRTSLLKEVAAIIADDDLTAEALICDYEALNDLENILCHIEFKFSMKTC